MPTKSKYVGYIKQCPKCGEYGSVHAICNILKKGYLSRPYYRILHTTVSYDRTVRLSNKKHQYRAIRTYRKWCYIGKNNPYVRGIVFVSC
jgi:hypothetical protein